MCASSSRTSVDAATALDDPSTLNDGSARIQRAMYGFMASQLLYTAIDLNVFGAIALGHGTLEQLLQQLPVSRRGLSIFLDGLVGAGFLNKQGSVYTLPEDVAHYLVPESSNYIGGMVEHCKQLYETWSLLTDVVRSGQPAGGASVLQEVETQFAVLVKGLYVSNRQAARRLTEQLLMGPNARFKATDAFRVLDVAGGSGVWSLTLLDQAIEAQAHILDFPTVLEVAETYVGEHGHGERVTFLPGDLDVIDLPQNAYHVAILGHICHALGAEATERLLIKLRKTLHPGGTLVIVDFVADNNREQAGWPLMFGVNMLVGTPEGNVFTEAQYQAWLLQAGFVQVTQLELEPNVSALIAHCP
ncbi:MAG: methyltransferase [Candidatus Melainabacteria bacterium]|nr:methyltransferase [Candidatus Melainabacteria bacterium]